MGRLDAEILDQILETLNDYAEKQLPNEKLLEIEHKDEFPEKVMKDLYDPMQIGLHLLTIDGYVVRTVKLWGLICRSGRTNGVIDRDQW